MIDRQRRLDAIRATVFVLLALATAILVARRGAGGISAPARAGGSALDQPIQSHLAYKADSLPNGLRYYISAHVSSSERTELRLIVDAGSMEEEDDQRGLAHAVEHMVFRGTRSFPRGAIDRYFDRIGMRRGDDLNGTTSFDDTQFRMSVPSARPSAIDTSLAMLASIAHEAVFDSADASREAGVLLEEWRGSLDAESRVRDARRPLLYAGTPYAERPVLGDPAVLRRFDIGAMRRFYDSWYRPELMGVVVVGDFEVASVEEMIRRHFGGIRAAGPRRPRPARPRTAAAAAPRALVVPDPETRYSSIGIWLPAVRQGYATRSDYRTSMIASLWRDALAARLADAELDADSPLADAGVERESLARDMSADVIDVTAMHGRTLGALDVTAAEMRVLAEEGPTAEELDERVRSLQRRTRENVEAGDDNATVAGELVDLFLTGNAVFTNATAYELARDVLPTITAADVRSFARSRTIDRNGTVIVVATTADDSAARVPSDAIIGRAREVRTRAPRERDAIIDVPDLLDTEPTPGRIVAEQPVSAIGAYQWTLSNGMRVLLKPTAFTFDNIELRAIAPGGASLADDDSYPSAYLADAIIAETGVGRIPAPRLQRWLSSTSISIAPTVTDDGIALDGHSAHADLDALFKLAHLYLTAPRRDTVAFRRYRARTESLVGDRARDPAVVFHDSVAAALARDPRAIRSGPQFYRRARLGDALDFWTRRSRNGSNFVVAIAGDFTLAGIRPLVERYLASLPRGERERPRERPPAKLAAVHHELSSGSVDRARTAIGFAAPFEMTSDNLTALYLVRDLIARSLTEQLRERMGGTYDVDVSLGVDVIPPARYTIRIEFESEPGRADALAAAVVGGLRMLRRSGPGDAMFRAAREARVRDYDERARDNEYWVTELTSHARPGWSLPDIATHAQFAAALTLGDARRACARYIAAGEYVRVTMRPKATPP